MENRELSLPNDKTLAGPPAPEAVTVICAVGVNPTPATYDCPPNRLKAMPAGERSQQRLEKFGPAALSDTELLAILLRTGIRERDVISLAGQLLAEAGSIARLASWNEADFRRIKGIGKVKAGQMVAIIETAKRMIAYHQLEEAPLLNRAELVASRSSGRAGRGRARGW